MKDNTNIEFTGHILIKDNNGKILVNKRTAQPKKEENATRIKDPYRRTFNNKR